MNENSMDTIVYESVLNIQIRTYIHSHSTRRTFGNQNVFINRFDIDEIEVSTSRA